MDSNSDIEAATETDTEVKPPRGLRELWKSSHVKTFRHILYAVFYRIFRLGGEITAVVLGLAMAGFWILLSVLDRQSTDLSALRPNFKIWFADAFDGRDAEFGRLEVTWLPASDNIVVTVEDAEVQGADGEVLERFELIRSTLAVGENWKALPKLINAEIKGGVLTYQESEDGRVLVGLGPPEAVGRIGPVYRSDERVDPDFDLKSLMQGIEFIQIDDADVYIQNEISGIDLKSDVESLRVAFSEIGDLTVAVEGNVEQASGQMPFSITSVVDEDFQNIKMRVKLEGARPDEIAPTKGRFWEMQGLEASVDLMAAVDFSRQDGLRSAEVDMDVGAGRFTLLRDKEPRSFPLDSLTTRANLAPGEDRMNILQLDLNSPKAAFKASGFLTELGKLSDGDENSSPTFDLSFKNIRANLTPMLSDETNIEQLDLVGQADFDSRQLNIDTGSLAFFDSTHSFNARLAVSNTNQIKSAVWTSAMTGTLTPDQFLSLWPVNAFGGARRWIDRSILSGDIRELTAGVNLDEAFFTAPALTEDRLRLRLSGQNVEVKYMDTMPKATGVTAQGEIRGNRLLGTFSGGNIEGVAIQSGTVEIPVLLPKGGDILIAADGIGPASEFLRLSDNPPFEIAKRYNVVPDDLRGQGDISIEVKRPLLEFFPREEILYQVNGNFTGVNAPFQLGRFEITDGAVKMDANRDRVIMSGPVNIGPWRANMRWQETLGDIASLTQYGVSGTVTSDVLDNLGLASRTWFDGSAAVLIEAEGVGKDIASATLDVDLTNSEISAERVWMKPNGEAARLQGRLFRSSDGGYILDDARIDGDGIDIRGRVELDAQRKAKQIDLSNVQIASLIDGTVRITPDRNIGQLGVDIQARFLDVSPWTEDLFAKRESNLDVPFVLKGNIERLILDPTYTVTNSVVDFSHTGEVIETARLMALSDGNPLKLALSTQETSKRQLVVEIPDASKAIAAFIGLNNTTGGQLVVNMNLPAAGEEGAITGEADMRNFRLTRAPAMAQLLSIASLTGLADTLTSGSMQFETFKLPFTMVGDDISIRDARLYGPALGMTADGDIDLDLRVMDFDGTLVPAYTANSILGDIPILGDIFVQEKDGGLFALTYTVSGPFEQTEIAVNPLSALTPGFLRNIFKRDRSDIDNAMKDAIEDVTPKVVEGP
jgi:hypothetical protein